jgi:hypothetical protein
MEGWKMKEGLKEKWKEGREEGDGRKGRVERERVKRKEGRKGCKETGNMVEGGTVEEGTVREETVQTFLATSSFELASLDVFFLRTSLYEVDTRTWRGRFRIVGHFHVYICDRAWEAGRKNGRTEGR